LKIPLEAANAFYEDPTQVVNASMDDVWVKKQKPHRKRSQMAAEPPPMSKLPQDGSS
jgi:hypothetical protein